jgi:poly(beta-D-mannuronate) lyase
MATTVVTSEAEFDTAWASVSAGDIIEFADGTYAGMTLNTVASSGTVTAPITIRAQNRNGAVINGAGNIAIRSSYIIVDGFYFDGITINSTMRLANGCVGSKIKNCYFYQCGPVSASQAVVRIESSSTGNLVEGCTFDGSNQLGIRLDVAGSDLCQHNTIKGNLFVSTTTTDSPCIQIGQDQTEQLDGYNIVESNTFDNCSTGSELISNKTNYNIFRDNLFLNCDSPLTLRGGAYCDVIGNRMIGGDTGLRLYGHDHNIIGNVIHGGSGTGIKIYCGTATTPGASTQAAQDCLVAGNTIHGCNNGIRVNGDYTVTTNEALPACDISANLLIANTLNDYVVAEQADGNTLTENTTGSDPGFINIAGDDFRLNTQITAGKFWTGETPTGNDGLRYMIPPSRGSEEVRGMAVGARVLPAGVDVARARVA